jgi:cytidyltransferase-like protein
MLFFIWFYDISKPLKRQPMSRKVVITSGYFNPIHPGHLNLFREARALGDFLVVIVNNDEQVKVKGSVPFMSESERMAIVGNLKHVDAVFLSIDKNQSVAESLKAVAKQYPGQLMFAKGGDRSASNIPPEETAACREYGIAVVNNVGGPKVQSSSWLIKNINTHQA